MNEPSPDRTDDDLQALFDAWNGGEEKAEHQLAAAIYPELRRLAASHLSHWSSDVSLQATELAHELFFKLVEQKRAKWQNREQFFAVLSRMMRRLVVDVARNRARQKRGGSWEKVPLEMTVASWDHGDVDVVALDRALTDLAEIDGEAARVVEALFFTGLTHDEAASGLGLGRATVGRKWRFARAWLRKRLSA